MQTFLPYPSFSRSAKSLDRQRLGKQRVEALQILYNLTGLNAYIVNTAVGEEAKKPKKNSSRSWSNHPAVLMWRGHEKALVKYGLAMCEEWISRGYKDTCTKKFKFVENKLECEDGLPKWIGNKSFHKSHKSNLVRKLPEYYGKLWPDVDGNLEYVWPTKTGA